MTNKDNNLKNILIVVIALAFIGVITYLFFSEVGKATWPVIAISVGTLGTLITVSSNLKIQIRNEQRPKKVEVYNEVIEFFFNNIFYNNSKTSSLKEEEIASKIKNITPKLILWASDDVLNIYIKFRQVANNKVESPPNAPVLLFGQILLAIRKDLGHQNDQLDEKSILSTFVNDVGNLSLENVKDLSK